MEYFWVHMLQHVTVMLAAPALYVGGAPWIPLLHALPVSFRRRVLRHIFLRPQRHPLRRFMSWLIHPWTGIVIFNIVMIIWMIPKIFDPVMAHMDLHVTLMLSSFFLSGLLFWVQFIPSHPIRITLSPFARVGALAITNVVMTIIAMAISFFTNGPLYTFGIAMPGMASMAMPMTTLNRFADQQIGAAILWVCGDFWCYPAIVTTIHRYIRSDRENSSGVFDRVLGGRHRDEPVDLRTPHEILGRTPPPR